MGLGSLVAGFILGLLTNYFYDFLKLKYRSKKSDRLIKILKEVKCWQRSGDDFFVYEKEPEYKIKINEGQDTLSGKYKKFPDREHDRICWVEVKYNEVKLFGWNFMLLDGGRLFLPVPKTGFRPDGTTYDYYDLSSTEILVFQIIGDASLMGEQAKNDLKKVCNILDIEIVKL